jgi:hypothetical protein
MTTKPTNGDAPAYPWEQSPGNQNNLGLTKREWLAGMAMQGLLSRDTTSHGERPRYEPEVAKDRAELAAHAAALADDMIAELEKPQ